MFNRQLHLLLTLAWVIVPKRHVGAFINDGEESSTMKEVKTDYGPVPLYVVDLVYSGFFPSKQLDRVAPFFTSLSYRILYWHLPRISLDVVKVKQCSQLTRKSSNNLLSVLAGVELCVKREWASVKRSFLIKPERLRLIVHCGGILLKGVSQCNLPDLIPPVLSKIKLNVASFFLSPSRTYLKNTDVVEPVYMFLWQGSLNSEQGQSVDLKKNSLVLFEVLVFSAEPDEGKHYNIKAYTNKDDPPEEVWREEWHQCYGERYKNDKKEGRVDGICVKVLFLHHGRLHMLRSLTKSCFMLPIETEKLLTELVEAEMNKRQILGHICYHILAAGLNGYMATITNLKSPSNKWRCGAAPITAMMSVKHDGHGYRAMTVGKPFFHPATVVDLRGKVYEYVTSQKLILTE
ncbi:pyrophosphate--fructose 6-phosphate 1-phosphotransferase subunit alpha [Tanacetum coccineum]